MSGFVFQREELKYLLTAEQRAAFEKLMARYMMPDRYAHSSIRNLYYDTPDYRLIRRSLEKPVYKEKLRLRSYGDPDRGGDVFLEMKKKYKGIVYKRRVEMTVEEAYGYMTDPAARLDAGQIGREIDYFKDFYRTLRPMVYLSYERSSWKEKSGDLRITMDYDVYYRQDRLDLRQSPGGRALLAEGEVLLEIKTAAAMPLWLVEFLSREKIRQRSFSKYGGAYTVLLQEQISESRGIPHV